MYSEVQNFLHEVVHICSPWPKRARIQELRNISQRNMHFRVYILKSYHLQHSAYILLQHPNMFQLLVRIKKGNECSSPQGKVKNFVLTIKNDNW